MLRQDSHRQRVMKAYLQQFEIRFPQSRQNRVRAARDQPRMPCRYRRLLLALVEHGSVMGGDAEEIDAA